MNRTAAIAVSGVTYWVDRPYDYIIPREMTEAVKPGMRVIVPFSKNNRRSEGIVLGINEHCEKDKLKVIVSCLDTEPILTERQIKLALWMRERFFCTVYDAVRVMLPTGLWFSSSGKRKVGDNMVDYARLAISGEEALELSAKLRPTAKKQSAVLSLMASIGEAAVSDIRDISGASAQTIKAICERGAIEIFKKEIFRRPVDCEIDCAPMPQLSSGQQEAYDGIRKLLFRGSAGCALLQGVTGSGKTSIYIRLIADMLEKGRGVILLVPEIALTPQMVRTFSSFFGADVALMHSSLTMGERYDEWKRVRLGEARLVIGTRSAVFAPVKDLGLIIIDEEQEETYKSESSPRYHARDIAKYRCAETASLLLLGSATPDIESRYRAETGSYAFFKLTERYNRMALPEVAIVDMKRELRAGNDTSVSSFLRQELRKNLDSGQQSILFINRRGASKLITCVDCGYTFKCPNCSVSLTYHSYAGRLMCHYCGFSRPVASSCPDCGGRLDFIGDGTQKIEEQLHTAFPDTEILRLDTDTVAQAGSHEALLERFRTEKIPIMIGTQMVTKGLNFDNVTLVGVLNADQRLYSGNYRDCERTFSLITQVIGRSGRATIPGRAVIQTFTPENRVIRLAAQQDYDGFYHEEIELRRVQKCPPFTQLIALTAVGSNEASVLECAFQVRKLLEHGLSGRLGTEILGPAPYSVVRVNRLFRYKISLACEPDRTVRALISKIIVFCNTDKNFRGVSVYADMNPSD